VLELDSINGFNAAMIRTAPDREMKKSIRVSMKPIAATAILDAIKKVTAK
jgi:hypothetical protein